ESTSPRRDGWPRDPISESIRPYETNPIPPWRDRHPSAVQNRDARPGAPGNNQQDGEASRGVEMKYAYQHRHQPHDFPLSDIRSPPRPREEQGVPRGGGTVMHRTTGTETNPIPPWTRDHHPSAGGQGSLNRDTGAARPETTQQ